MLEIITSTNGWASGGIYHTVTVTGKGQFSLGKHSSCYFALVSVGAAASLKEAKQVLVRFGEA